MQTGHRACSDGLSGSRGPDDSPLTPFFRRILMFDLRAVEEVLLACSFCPFAPLKPSICLRADL